MTVIALFLALLAAAVVPGGFYVAHLALAGEPAPTRSGAESPPARHWSRTPRRTPLIAAPSRGDALVGLQSQWPRTVAVPAYAEFTKP